MKSKFAGLALLAGLMIAGDSSAFGQLSIRIGPPPVVRVERYRPPMPGPGYIWVNGYWYPAGNRYVWHQGYWTRPPYEGANWIGPRYEGEQFYEGRWEGGRGVFQHDHRWDRDRDRDYGRYDRRDRDRDHDDHDRR